MHEAGHLTTIIPGVDVSSGAPDARVGRPAGRAGPEGRFARTAAGIGALAAFR